MTEQLEMFGLEKFFNTDQELKHCSRCDTYLPLDCFIKISRFRADGTPTLRNKCRNCFNNGVRVAKKLKETIPPPDENYRCPICLKNKEELLLTHDQTKKMTKTTWCLDHDHETDTFRGWLCNTCNSSLGWLDDDVDNLERALNYLHEHEKRC